MCSLQLKVERLPSESDHCDCRRFLQMFLSDVEHKVRSTSYQSRVLDVATYNKDETTARLLFTRLVGGEYE